MQFLNNFAVYDWITIIYITVVVACFTWTSIGNDYVFNKIEKSIQSNNSLDHRVEKCDIYYLEIRKSWLRNQNIWISVEYFLVGLAYANFGLTEHSFRTSGVSGSVQMA